LALLLPLLGGFVGVALGRYVWPAIRGGDPAALLAAQLEAARLEEECRALRALAQQLEVERAAGMEELRRSGEGAARLSERVDSLTRQAEDQGRLARGLEGQRDAAAAEAKSAVAEVARLKERERALLEKIAELSPIECAARYTDFLFSPSITERRVETLSSN
jgi:chromosome segregation ATPase